MVCQTGKYKAADKTYSNKTIHFIAILSNLKKMEVNPEEIVLVIAGETQLITSCYFYIDSNKIYTSGLKMKQYNTREQNELNTINTIWMFFI